MGVSWTTLTASLGAPGMVATAIVQRQLADTILEHPEIYERKQCAANIRSFLSCLRSPEVRQQADVLVLLSQRVRSWEDLTKKRYLLPAPRQSLYDNVYWPHHVILISGGRVYDFDYTGVPGTDVGDYVTAMFAAGADCIDAVVVPANRFGARLGDVLWRTLDGQQFPRLPLLQFAAERRKQYGRQSPYPDLITRQQSHAAFKDLQTAV